MFVAASDGQFAANATGFPSVLRIYPDPPNELTVNSLKVLDTQEFADWNAVWGGLVRVVLRAGFDPLTTPWVIDTNTDWTNSLGPVTARSCRKGSR